MQKLWKHYIELARQNLRGHIPGRNLCEYLERTTFRTNQEPSQKRNGGSSGFQRQIFDTPARIIGKTICFMDRVPCHKCEQFNTYDICEGINNPDRCPQTMHQLKVESIAYQWDRYGLTYIINKGDAEIKPEKLSDISMKPWMN